MNIGELAAYICSFLNKHDIECILSGGACVTIYTNNKYQSYDIDFIDNASTPRKKIKSLLSVIGFEENNRYFVHKDTEFFIEFPSGPLSVGKEPITNFNTIEFETGKLLLLTPTDCIKDRLAAYYHWEDKQALAQAILVAQNCHINLKEVERWSKVENQLKKFALIKDRLKKRKKNLI
jgi:phosphorylcholine metabolism protein LicD